MFRRSSTRYGETPVAETPYQRAQQAWDERIGSARVHGAWRPSAGFLWPSYRLVV